MIQCEKAEQGKQPESSIGRTVNLWGTHEVEYYFAPRIMF